jgi:uncharacterized alkaline shock family protein YloU
VEETLGKITIAPEVLVTIAQLTALNTPGVVRLSSGPPARVTQWLGGVTFGNGVQVEVQDNTVAVDLYLVAQRGTNLLQLGRKLQEAIARAVEDIVGMPVREVNVRIEDVAPEAAEPG